MIFKFEFKMIVPVVAAVALAACSAYGNEADLYGVQHAYGVDQAYGANQAYADASYYSEMASFNNSPCYSGPQGYGGLRGGQAPTQVVKSRYGYVPEGLGCAPSGYWVHPQPQYVVENQIVQQQVTEQVVAPTIVEPRPQAIVIEACPDGQYRASNGECAIVITEAPIVSAPVYTPPIYTPPQSFPVPVDAPIISYLPVRK
ncbi:MAG: hypothetical protein ABJ275_10940 [Maricaulaceae bacterium]